MRQLTTVNDSGITPVWVCEMKNRLTGKTVHIVGPRRLENELLIPPPSSAPKAKPPRPSASSHSAEGEIMEVLSFRAKRGIAIIPVKGPALCHPRPRFLDFAPSALRSE